MDPVLVPLIGIVFGIPAMAFGARLVIKPVVDAWLRSRELKAGTGASATVLEAHEQRFAQLEGEIASMREEMDRLSAVESFYTGLQGGAAGAAASLAGGRPSPPEPARLAPSSPPPDGARADTTAT